MGLEDVYLSLDTTLMHNSIAMRRAGHRIFGFQNETPQHATRFDQHAV